ncbi:MAG: chromate resistance protein ChrB domain-containing protein [Limisphaerales bacterium]
METLTWLLLLYALPTKRTTARVNLWRRLKKFGAIQLKTSAYVLPDKPVHHERFQWLAKQIRDEDGEATLVRVAEIEDLSHEDLRQLFNAARTEEYKTLMTELQSLLGKAKKSKEIVPDLELFQRRFNEIREIDYFDSPKAQEAQMLLQKATRLLTKTKKEPLAALLNKSNYQNRSWLTRPRPGIDRVGSAWLIRKFIDPKAKFVFGMDPGMFPGALPFDMADVEFSHHGDDCSFETFLKRFGIEDKSVRKIGEMIHDADLEDGKFQRIECIGLNAVFEGWAKMGLADETILEKGGECFEALYRKLQKK